MDQNFSMLNFFKKLIFISKIFGFTVFKYPNDSFKISWINLTLSVLNVLINLIKLIGMGLHAQTKMTTNLSKNMQIVETLMMITFTASLICTSSIMIINMFLSKRVFKTVKFFENLDEEVFNILIKLII